MKSRFQYIFLLFILSSYILKAQQYKHDIEKFTWKGSSVSSAGSMPLGGAGMGLNVWMENGNLYIYFAHNSWFDENNALLKGGRIRIKINPALSNEQYTQVLDLKNGEISIKGKDHKQEQLIRVQTSMFHASSKISIQTSIPTTVEMYYENWRYEDRALTTAENNGNSYKWDKKNQVIAYKDSIYENNNKIRFFHQNKTQTIFDITVSQQKLESIKSKLWNPLGERIMGGSIYGNDFLFSGLDSGFYSGTKFHCWKLKSNLKKQHELYLNVRSEGPEDKEKWKNNLIQQEEYFFKNQQTEIAATKKWWNDRYEKSFIRLLNHTDTSFANCIRNYQLFRFMVNASSTGIFPIKFNGGLFTFDPVYTDQKLQFNPDFRKWGGGIFTAQNQRLIYWPLLRSGDVDLIKPALDLYLKMLPTAEARAKQYWGHSGAAFTEQIELFGLPNMVEYGLKRPADFDPGVEYNAWLEYEWDTVLEFCLMALEANSYGQLDIKPYLPLILSSLRFFDEHYQFLASKRGINKLDENGHLILYPSSAGETFKVATNPSSLIAGLIVVTNAALSSGLFNKDDIEYLTEFKKRIPPISYQRTNGKISIAPAKNWERVNNVESMMLYPVFPWGIFGMGNPGLDTAIHTYLSDSFAVKFRSHIGWKQDNIFAARLGLTDDALALTKAKLANGPFRFPAFWGPGFDWTPDHNWGGSGMIGLQEMLLQTPDQKILLFPAWPANKDVHFKLHAPGQTIVEAKLENGKVSFLQVTPKERKKDVIICLN